MDFGVRGSTVVPNDLFLRGHYTRPPTITKKDVAVREPGTVSQFGLLWLSVNCHVNWYRVCPLYLTVTHEIDRLIGFNEVPLSAVKKWMLSETMARKRTGCHWIRRYRRNIVVRCGRRSGRRGCLRCQKVYTCQGHNRERKYPPSSREKSRFHFGES